VHWHQHIHDDQGSKAGPDEATVEVRMEVFDHKGMSFFKVLQLFNDDFLRIPSL
jgi:hypothetical protein